VRFGLRPGNGLSQAYSIFRLGYLIWYESRGRRADRGRLKDSKAIPRRLRRGRAPGTDYTHTVFPSIAITALDILRPSIWLRAFADSVSGLVIAEAVTDFLIGTAAGVTQVYRVASNGFLNDGSEGRGCSGALRSSEFGRRRVYLRRGSRLLIVASAVF
jgi:hypothetical protein